MLRAASGGGLALDLSFESIDCVADRDTLSKTGLFLEMPYLVDREPLERHDQGLLSVETGGSLISYVPKQAVHAAV
jgi:hypothetical protein